LILVEDAPRGHARGWTERAPRSRRRHCRRLDRDGRDRHRLLAVGAGDLHPPEGNIRHQVLLAVRALEVDIHPNQPWTPF
jgi:hypothetical protein